MSVSPYAAAPADKLEEIVRLAESRLQAQLTLGIAADQRAMTMATVLTAVAGAFIGFAGAQKDPAGWTLIVLIAGFAVAAVLAVIAALPSAWEVPGCEPGQWLEDIVEGDTLQNGKAAMLDFYDEMIEANHQTLKAGANWVRYAFVAVLVTLAVAGFVAIVS